MTVDEMTMSLLNSLYATLRCAYETRNNIPPTSELYYIIEDTEVACRDMIRRYHLFLAKRAKGA